MHAFGDVRSGRADSPVRQGPARPGDRARQRGIGPPGRHQEPRRTGASLRRHRGRKLDPEHGQPRHTPSFASMATMQLDDFTDKIHWAGRKVAYDRIQTYRRDEVHQIGGPPKIYNRANWSTAFLPTDESPILGDVKFLRETDPSQAAWKIDRDDFKLAPGQPDRRNRSRPGPHPGASARGRALTASAGRSGSVLFMSEPTHWSTRLRSPDHGRRARSPPPVDRPTTGWRGFRRSWSICSRAKRNRVALRQAVREQAAA